MEKNWRNTSTHNPTLSRHTKRVLFANVPADGHFNPLTGIALHLTELGYDVRWYSASIFEEKVKKLGLHYYPFKKAMDINGDNIDQLLPERVQQKSMIKKLNYDLEHFFVRRSVEYYQDISEIYREFPFDLMIADAMFTGIPLVKEKLGVPVIAIGITPLLAKSKDLAPVGLGKLPARNLLEKWQHALLRKLAVSVIFKKPNKLWKQILKDNEVSDLGEDMFDILVKHSDLFLQIGSPSFEYKRSDLGENIRYIGALAPKSKDWKKAPWYSPKLSQYNKIILVTQGTVEKNTEKIIIPTLEAFKNSEYLVVVTTGGSQTAELRKQYPHNNVIIEDFIAFADIMPYADVYISNGGFGGVMLAIENHLPLVVAGTDEGKNEINARIGYFGLGIDLKTQWPKAEQIKAAVEKVCKDTSYRKNVCTLSDELNNYDSLNLCAEYAEGLINENKTTWTKQKKSELRPILQY